VKKEKVGVVDTIYNILDILYKKTYLFITFYRGTKRYVFV